MQGLQHAKVQTAEWKSRGFCWEREEVFNTGNIFKDFTFTTYNFIYFVINNIEWNALWTNSAKSMEQKDPTCYFAI